MASLKQRHLIVLNDWSYLGSTRDVWRSDCRGSLLSLCMAIRKRTLVSLVSLDAWFETWEHGTGTSLIETLSIPNSHTNMMPEIEALGSCCG